MAKQITRGDLKAIIREVIKEEQIKERNYLNKMAEMDMRDMGMDETMTEADDYGLSVEVAPNPAIVAGSQYKVPNSYEGNINFSPTKRAVAQLIFNTNSMGGKAGEAFKVNPQATKDRLRPALKQNVELRPDGMYLSPNLQGGKIEWVITGDLILPEGTEVVRY